MALRRAIGSLAVRSLAYCLRRAAPSASAFLPSPDHPLSVLRRSAPARTSSPSLCLPRSVSFPPSYRLSRALKVKKVAKDANDDAAPAPGSTTTSQLPSSGSSPTKVGYGRDDALTHSHLPCSIHSPLLNHDFCIDFAGHNVVPGHEALQMAVRMGLDLVEVLHISFFFSCCAQVLAFSYSSSVVCAKCWHFLTILQLFVS